MKLSTGHLCPPHRTGVIPGFPPFYAAGCGTCEAKKAKGLVTGSEPPPPSVTKLRRAAWRQLRKARQNG